jgi:hypothetical protein
LEGAPGQRRSKLVEKSACKKESFRDEVFPVNSILCRNIIFALMACLLCVRVSSAQTSKELPAAPNWQGLEFLVGDWIGQGGGQPGAGTGAYSFHPELDGQVLVRHSHSEYPNDKTGAVQKHDDLMIVYRESPGDSLRAVYFDSEGHVIHYSVSTQSGSAVFESEPTQPGPRFRLSYRLSGKNVDGKFEVAAPGTTEYKSYLTWTSTKK